MGCRDIASRSGLLGLALSLAGCQAPGFLSISADSTGPQGIRASATAGPPDGANLWLALEVPDPLARQLHLVPAATDSLGATASIDPGEVALDGAQLIVATASGSYTYSSTSGSPGLNVPGHGTAVVTAELAQGGRTYRLMAVGVLASGSMPVRTVVDLATTLSTSLLLSRLPSRGVYAVPPGHLNDLYTAAEQAIRNPDGSLRADLIPDLSSSAAIAAEAAIVARSSDVAAALQEALSDAQEAAAAPPATVSLATIPVPAMASADPSLPGTDSATVSAAVPAATTSAILGWDPAPFTGGEVWLYRLYDQDGHPVGLLRRTLDAGDRDVLTGLDRITFDDHTATASVWLRHTASDPDQPDGSMGWRTGTADSPSRTYPLPWSDGQSWQAGEGLMATAHYLGSQTVAGTAYPDCWRVDFTATSGSFDYHWSEWWAQGPGLIRFELADPSTLTKYDAQLIRFHPG